MKLSSRLFSLISKKKALKATLALTGFLLTTATLSIASTVFTANKASAELITSRGFGVSLNTNYNYRKIYGEPRMSVYATNPNDGDQQFDRIQGNAGWMLKHRGTGKCLNAYSKYSGAEPFIWPCNPADMDQNWEMLDKGNGYVLYRLKNTGMCLTADTPVGNSSIVALRDCAYNGANGTQDWIGSLNPNSPVYGGTNSTVTNSDPLNEVWIVARKRSVADPLYSAVTKDLGHAFIALIRRDQELVTVTQNGNVIQRYTKDKGSWYRMATYGMWPNTDLTVNNSSDVNNLNTLFQAGSLSPRGHAVRRSRIGTNRANWIYNGAFREAGCLKYAGIGGTGTDCNCLDYSTRMWHYLTANWDDFRISGWWGAVAATTKDPYYVSPDYVVDQINSKNQSTGSDYLDGGKIWQ
jgi:hypothetical protein